MSWGECTPTHNRNTVDAENLVLQNQTLSENHHKTDRLVPKIHANQSLHPF